MPVSEPIKNCDMIIVDGVAQNKGRRKRIWVKAIKQDLKMLNFVE